MKILGANMPRRTIDVEEWDDDFDDDDSTVPCPHCSRSIPEDVVRCPYCENYISDEDAPPARKPWWLIIGVLVCLYVVYCWTTGG